MSCKIRDEEIAADDQSNATYFNAKMADMFAIIGNESGIDQFGYDNVNGIYDISREASILP